MGKQLVLWHAKGWLLMNKMMLVLKEEDGADEFNDGGSTNWGRNIAIGFAIAFVIFGLVKGFAPEIVNSWKGKIMQFFN